MNCLRKRHKKNADNCTTMSTDGIGIRTLFSLIFCNLFFNQTQYVTTWGFTTDEDKQQVDVSVWDMAGQGYFFVAI